MVKKMQFRAWVEQLWQANCEEREQFLEAQFSRVEYFQRFKYWLKREYRRQQKENA
jgi:hypothetical protein